jgi:hypothetical protein
MRKQFLFVAAMLSMAVLTIFSGANEAGTSKAELRQKAIEGDKQQL